MLERSAQLITNRVGGWGHHRWLVLIGDQTIEFLFKHRVVKRWPLRRLRGGG